MATRVIYVGDGSNSFFDINFPYDDPTEIVVTVNGQAASYIFVSPSRIQTNLPPDAGSAVIISRVTDISTPAVVFKDTAVLTEDDLNLSIRQLINRLQEQSDKLNDVAGSFLATPVGEGVKVLPTAASRAGKVLAFDAAGEPTTASLSGTDDSLRGQLASSIGGSFLKANQTGPGARGTFTALDLFMSVPIYTSMYSNPAETDDALTLQRAINAAHLQGRPILLEGRRYNLYTKLDVKGKLVHLTGVAGLTELKAMATMTHIIDAVEVADSYYNPLLIENLILNGNYNVTVANFEARFRHPLLLRSIWSIFPKDTAACFKAADCWLGRYYDLRTAGGKKGFDAVGALHSSTWTGCSFNATKGPDGVVVDIGNVTSVTPSDGNHGLTFVGCDVEFSDPTQTGVTGVRVKENTSVLWLGGYLGEDLYGGPVVDLQGGTFKMVGGIAFYGKTAGTKMTHPIKGNAQFDGTRISNQGTNNVSDLIGLTDAEIATATGKVRFTDIDIYAPFGGIQFLPGDALDVGIPAARLVYTNGRAWDLQKNDADATKTVDNEAAVVTVTAAGTTAPLAGLGTSVSPDFAPGTSAGKYGMVLVTYSSTKPVFLRFSTGGAFGAPALDYGLLPSTGGIMRTFINSQNPLPLNENLRMEIFMNNPAIGDVLKLKRVSVFDSAVANGSANGGPKHLGHVG